jgi:hypothetical protein
MSSLHTKHPFRLIARLLLTVILANAVFLLLTFAGYLTAAPVGERILTAFARGELVYQDYIRFNSRLGFHQYNDCVVLQMLYYRDPANPRLALGPSVYFSDDPEISQCKLLHQLVNGNVDRRTIRESYYARYWHGYNALVSFGLKYLDIVSLRKLFSLSAWLAIGLLALVSLRSGHYVRRAGLVIALSALLFWALPFFSSNFTHGPGDILVLIGVTIPAVSGRRLTRIEQLLPYSAFFGAAIVFMEMLTGQLPTAAAWLVVMVLAIYRDHYPSEDKKIYWTLLLVLVAYGIGAVGTVVIKQVLAFYFLGHGVTEAFVGNLRLYISIPASQNGVPGFLLSFERLYHYFNMLVYGRKRSSLLIANLMVLIWIVNLSAACLIRSAINWKDVAAIFLAACIPVAWILLLNQHTYIHAGFMVRILVVPLSLAPLPFLWFFNLSAFKLRLAASQ